MKIQQLHRRVCSRRAHGDQCCQSGVSPGCEGDGSSPVLLELLWPALAAGAGNPQAVSHLSPYICKVFVLV